MCCLGRKGEAIGGGAAGLTQKHRKHFEHQ
jgi:hypothetical protein